VIAPKVAPAAKGGLKGGLRIGPIAAEKAVASSIVHAPARTMGLSRGLMLSTMMHRVARAARCAADLAAAARASMGHAHSMGRVRASAVRDSRAAASRVGDAGLGRGQSSMAGTGSTAINKARHHTARAACVAELMEIKAGGSDLRHAPRSPAKAMGRATSTHEIAAQRTIR